MEIKKVVVITAHDAFKIRDVILDERRNPNLYLALYNFDLGYFAFTDSYEGSLNDKENAFSAFNSPDNNNKFHKLKALAKFFNTYSYIDTNEREPLLEWFKSHKNSEGQQVNLERLFLIHFYCLLKSL